MWLKLPDQPELAMLSDFDTGMLGEAGADTLLKMREKADLSQRTLWAEMRRRNILSPNFDPEAEEAAIIEEMPGDDFDDRLAATLN